MAANIDFASLSLQDALDLAILVEEEAQERYLEFVDQMEQHHTPEAAKFFAMMARNEQKHGEELRARRHDLFGDAPRRVKPSMLWDVEAPDYEFSPAPSCRPGRRWRWRSRPRRRPTSSSSRPSRHLGDPEVKRLFQDLRDEEVLHQSLVREAMRGLPGGQEPDAGDYEDEPVAQ